MNSTLIGFTELRRSLLTRNVKPPSLKTSSFSFGSSRAMPSEGPAHPPSDIMILMDWGSLASLRYSLITSTAFWDTWNIINSLAIDLSLSSANNNSVGYFMYYYQIVNCFRQVFATSNCPILNLTQVLKKRARRLIMSYCWTSGFHKAVLQESQIKERIHGDCQQTA